MDKKAVSEIKKAVSHSDCRIDKITGIFVDENGEIITELKETWNAMQAEETEKFCELFSKVLSGKLGKNLYNMEFPLQEEMEEGKQAKLYEVLQNGFDSNKEAAKELLDTIRENYDRAGRQLILLAHGAYDIPAKAGDNITMEDASEYVYLFLVCAVCPVVEVKEGLCYDESTFSFINKRTDLGVQMPSVGFLFPAFNDRLPDIHSLLYYAKKEDERHLELIDALVGSDMPASESVQKEVFSELVEKTLGEECDFQNVKELTNAVNELLKEEKDADGPVELGEVQVRRILTQAGISGAKLQNLPETFEETVGEGKTLSGENIGGRTVMEIKSPSIKISVKSDMTDMISTRVIGGREYLLIPLQEDVELNGIRLYTREKQLDKSYEVGTGEDRDEEKPAAGPEETVNIPF